MSSSTSDTSISNAYTDAPELHPNLFLGGLQLLLWLFVHPAAWRSHLARMDPDLRPDFCLAELSRTQWHNPVLRHLLLTGWGLWLLLIGLLIGPGLWIAGQSGPDLVQGIVESLMRAAAGSLVVSLAFGVTAGLAFGVTFGLAFSVRHLAGGVVAGTEHAVAAGVLLGVMLGVAGRRPAYAWAQQMGGVLLGGLMGGLMLSLAALAAYVLANGVPASAGDLVRAEVNTTLYVVLGMAFGSGLLALFIGSRTHSWRRGLRLGIGVGMMYAVANALTRVLAESVPGGLGREALWGVAFGLWAGPLHGVYIGLPYALAEPVVGPWAGGVASVLVYGGWLVTRQVSRGAPPGATVVFYLVGVTAGLTLRWWRPVVVYPIQAAWNMLLYRTDTRAPRTPHRLRWHTAFWDQDQRLPLVGLVEHVVLVMERDPVEGRAAIEYLATSHQRRAARAAQIELDARHLERCRDVQALRQAHRSLAAGELEGPASALLRSFGRASQDIDAALAQGSAYNQRLALSAVEERLDGLARELTRSSERYAVRFLPIAIHWRRIAGEHVHTLARETEQSREIDNPYVIGVPLTEQQEIFVGRTDVSARIEGLLLDRRRPPLLLYGQRRTGKTSLLNNLGRLLPSTIVPFFVDLQGPATQASDHAGFFYNVSRGMVDSARRRRGLALPPMTREALVADPFTRFDEWLDQVDALLGQRTALLALDELEALDNAVATGRLDEGAVLGALRHLIQHRPRFKVLLAGSHTLDELGHWAGYLINVQVVKIGYLKEAEVRQLVERPVQDFCLRYARAASQRVLDLTRGHPFLVQLLCAEIVALKNEQPPAVRRLARLADVEAAIPDALRHGVFFFADIEHNQVDADGLALLCFLAAQGEGAVFPRPTLARHGVGELEGALTLLCRRELIEAVDGGYRFQVELIRRWFARGPPGAGGPGKSL